MLIARRSSLLVLLVLATAPLIAQTVRINTATPVNTINPRDSVGAGVGEKVLVVIEGRAAGDALGRKAAAVDAAIIGIVDSVDYEL